MKRVSVLLLLLLPTAVFAQWPTTEWHVRCTEATLAAVGAELCDDTSITGSAAVARFELERASEWLEGLGFRPPDVERHADGRYLAWISDEDQVIDEDKEAWGTYFPSTSRLTLASNFWLVGRDLDVPGKIAYLTDVFEADLEPEVGLVGLHDGLSEWASGGLYEVYPEFIARHATHPGLFRSAYTEDRLPQPAAGAPVTTEYSGTVQPVASHAYDVILPAVGSDVVGVTVTLDSPEESLHLIVDGARYDDPGPDRNRFQTLRYHDDDADTLRVRIANVGPDPAATREAAYTLSVRLDPGVDFCDEHTLVSVHNRRSRQWEPLIEQAVVLRTRAVAADRDGLVHPFGQGLMSVNGDGGVACVTPFGVSDREWEDDRAPDRSASDTMDELVERHIGRVSRESGVPEATLRKMLAGERPENVMPQQWMAVMKAVQRIAAEPQSENPEASGVFFHIFSPHLATALTGGISPDGPETPVGFYTRWQGDWKAYRCGSREREDFKGEQTTLYGRLEGTVTITEVTPTQIVGTFQLTGPGKREIYTGTVEHSEDPECRWACESEEKTENTSLYISGRFTAPNVRGPVTFPIAGVGRAVPVGR